MLVKYGIDDLESYNQKKRDNSELIYFLDWNGILLNLSYIYPNMALMCMPSEKDIYKRNDIRIISDFIHEKCRDHFYIFNVHENNYDTNFFDNKVIFKPFPDHCSPSLTYFDESSALISNILKNDPKCTIFIHCKAGRGRSGTVVCAYQIFSKHVSHVQEAIDTVNEKRSPQHLSISIPSQLRFLRYYERKCLMGSPQNQTIKLKRLVISPHFNHKMVLTLTNGIPFEDEPLFAEEFDGQCFDFDHDEKTRDRQLSQDFAISIAEVGALKDSVRIQLHSDYLNKEFEQVSTLDEPNNFVVVLSKYELDGPHNRKTAKNFPEDFSMSIYYEVIV